MSEETNTATVETADVDPRGPQERVYTQEEVTALLAETVERAEKAEKQRQKANAEAANRRVREKQLTEELASLAGTEATDASAVVAELAAIKEENRAWKVEELLKQASEKVGVPSELVGPWMKAQGRLDDIDISDRLTAAAELETRVTQFAENFPTTVRQASAPIQQSWGTPEAQGTMPVSDAETALWKALQAGPEEFNTAWEKYDGDRLMNEGAFARTPAETVFNG